MMIEKHEGDLLLGANAIAEFLGITRRQAYRLSYDGLLPSFKVGGTLSARRSSLQRWLEQAEQSSARAGAARAHRQEMSPPDAFLAKLKLRRAAASGDLGKKIK